MIKDKTKLALIEQLKQTPIIEVACKKTGVSRATFYRWKKTNKEFAKKAEKAIAHGRYFINDVAESQLVQAIKDGNMTAIIFWLKNNKKLYGNKLEVQGKIETKAQKLTDGQKELIKEALRKSNLIQNDPISINKPS